MRRHVVLMATVACMAVVAPAVALPNAEPVVSGASTVEELQRLRDRLSSASGDLAALDAAVAAATSQLDEIEGRLTDAEAQLGEVRADLAAAERSHARSSAEAAEATTALRRANDALDRAHDRVVDQEAVMADRVRSMWKFGGSDPRDLMLEGLVRSEDLHDATMTLRAVQTLVEDDRELVEQATTTTRTEARQRAVVAEARQHARRAEARARAETQRVATLVIRQERLVASVSAERAARQGVLHAVASDREATARLVEKLEERVAQLSRSLARAIVAVDPDATFDGPPPAWAAALPGRGRALSPAIAGAAASAGVDPRLFAALVWSESNFHPGAMSHVGAQGLAQLMPATAARLGVDSRDPVQNLVGGARYLRAQLDRFGSADLALAAYNAGPGRVQAAGNRIPQITETQVYVLRVLERYQRLVALS